MSERWLSVYLIDMMKFLSLMIFACAIPALCLAQDEDWVRVQIVNATCAEDISVSIDDELLYPNFPQGLYTADGKTRIKGGTFQITKLRNQREVERFIQLPKNTDQSLFIIGDFSIDVPPEEMPQPEVDAPPETDDAYPPNVHLVLLPHTLEPDQEPVRVRFLNAVPGQLLTVHSEESGELQILPGEHKAFIGQSSETEYQAKISGDTVPVHLRQEGPLRNCTVVFYLAEGRASFARIFENTKAFREASMAEMEKDE